MHEATTSPPWQPVWERWSTERRNGRWVSVRVGGVHCRRRIRREEAERCSTRSCREHVESGVKKEGENENMSVSSPRSRQERGPVKE